MYIYKKKMHIGLMSRMFVAPSPTPRCSSYRKGILWVTLDHGRQLYFTLYFANGPGDLVSIPKVLEIGVQSLVESYQSLEKWYLMPPCLTLSIIRYGSRVKWSILGKEQRPPIHLRVVAIEKGAFGSCSTTVANFTYTHTHTFPIF